VEAWRDQTSLLVETELVVSEVRVEVNMVDVRGVEVGMVDVRDGGWGAGSWWCADWERHCRILVVETRVWLRARLVLTRYVPMRKAMWLWAIVFEKVILENFGIVLRSI